MLKMFSITQTLFVLGFGACMLLFVSFVFNYFLSCCNLISANDDPNDPLTKQN